MKNINLAWKSAFALLGIYFVIVIYILSQYILPHTTDYAMKSIITILTIQNVIQIVILIAGLICLVKYKEKKALLPFQSMVIISDTGEIKKEINLIDKQSLVLIKNDNKEINLCNSQAEHSKGKQYAVINYVGGIWYIEVLSDKYKIGLKKENENMVYRLKAVTPYKLSVNDIIYIESNKIIIK